MATNSFQKKVQQANRRIERIKDAGMQPITLKSPANIIERFVEKKGTSKEGRIKSWKQVSLEYGKEITKEEYEQSIEDFLNSYYGKQTYFNEAYKYYSERIIDQLIEEGYDNEEISRLYNLPKKEFIDKINEAHEKAKNDKDSGGSSNSFYYYLFQYSDEKE